MRSTADSWEFPPPAGEGRSKGCRWWQKRASNEETRSGSASFVDGGSGGWSQRRKQRQGADAKSAPDKNLAVFNCDLRVYVDVVRMSNTGNPSPPKKKPHPLLQACGLFSIFNCMCLPPSTGNCLSASAYFSTVTLVMCGLAPSYQYRKPSMSTLSPTFSSFTAL